MKKTLLSNDSAWYIYLSKPMLQLLNIDPPNSFLLFKIKDKVLHIEEAAEEKIKNLKNPLIKKLTKKGNSWSLYIPLPLLELIDIEPEKDMADITINGETLLIKKAD